MLFLVKREAFNIELYKNIKFLREKLNLSQEELALRVGYKDRSAIAKVEAGCVDLPQSKIAAFAKALNASPAELMGITNSPPIDDSPYDKSIFAQNLLRYMKEKGINKTDLSGFLKVSPSTVSDWCNGKKIPRMDKIERMSTFFHVPMSDLIEDRMQKKTALQEDSLNPLDKYYMDLFSQLNEDQQGVVLALIKTLSERK